MVIYLDSKGGLFNMRSDEKITLNVKKWLKQNKRSQAWLAKEMEIAPSLLSQLFSGERRLQTSHIEKMSKLTGMSIPDLASSSDEEESLLTYSLRGEISTIEGERALAQLLLDAEHYVHLLLK